MRNLNVGDRVIIPSTIACGACSYCRAGYYAQCDKANPNGPQAGSAFFGGDGPSQALIWAVKAVAKAGTVSIIGVYPQTARSFPIGKAMNKNLTLKMGNCNHLHYIPMLVDLVHTGALDPTKILTQRAPLASAIEAYQAFDARATGWLKVKLTPTA